MTTNPYPVPAPLKSFRNHLAAIPLYKRIIKMETTNGMACILINRRRGDIL